MTGNTKTDDYAALRRVYALAVDQAEKGKGRIRHSCGEPFESQKICRISRSIGSAFALGQALKKAEESVRLDGQDRLDEILGAMNYLAAVYIVEEEWMGCAKDCEDDPPPHGAGHGRDWIGLG